MIRTSNRSPIPWRSIRALSTSKLNGGKQTYKEMKQKSNCARALEHFDDFYGTFYGKRKWPQLRLGLMSPTKYVAIPNPFTGNLDGISKKLENIGGYNMHTLWDEGRDILGREIDVKKDLGRIHSLEKTLEFIAVTKKAEEMEVLYQNAPHKKGMTSEHMFQNQSEGTDRMYSHPSQAAFMPPSKLKGVGEFAFDSEYYAGFLPQNLHSMLDPDDDHPFVYTDPSKTKLIKWPTVFRPFTFELGSGEKFPISKRDKDSELREYICVNGASIAPILALDLNPGVDLLDICAAPGTKSLMALMTLAIGSITCNDLDFYRMQRVKNIFQEFTGKESPESANFTRCNAKDYYQDKKYHRVLADVPCSNDRISCNESDNSIFKTTRTKERLDLVNVQKAILKSSLQTMRPEEGSVTVYSTCTLSPVENDGVVMHALKETEVRDLAVDIYGLLNLLKPLERRGFFRISRTRFGVLIEPSIVSNFGPMFVSRIIVQKQALDNEEPKPHEKEDPEEETDFPREKAISN